MASGLQLVAICLAVASAHAANTDVYTCELSHRTRPAFGTRATFAGKQTNRHGKLMNSFVVALVADLSVLLPSGGVETYVRISPPSQVFRDKATDDQSLIFCSCGHRHESEQFEILFLATLRY